MCRLVTRKVAYERDLMVVCRGHGVATCSRRHGVCFSVRVQELLGQIRVCLHFVAHPGGFSQLQPILLLGIQEATDSGLMNVMKDSGML